MKHAKTTLFVLIAAVALAGCSGNKANNGSTNEGKEEPTQSTAPTAESKKEIMELTLMEPTWGTNQPESNDFVNDSFKEDVGVSLRISGFASDEELDNKLNVLAAASDLPDLMVLDKMTLQQYAKRGLLLDLTSYVEQLDKVKSLVGEESFKKSTIDGKVFGVPKTTNIAPQTYWIRKDWLNNLGLPMPSTLDEFHETLVAFTENDPDKNGKKDTYGLTGLLDVRGFSPIYAAFGAAYQFQIRDGKLVNFYEDPQTKEALGYIRKLADAKVLDPDYATNKPGSDTDKAYKGQAGVFFNQWTAVYKDEVAKQWKTANPNAEWDIVPPFKDGKYGEYLGIKDLGGNGGFVAISSRVGNDKEKLQKIIDLLNYVSEGKGLNLVQFGIEGTHFTVENGNVKTTDKISEAKDSWIYQLTGRPEATYLKAKFPKQEEWIDRGMNQPRIDTYDGYIEPLEGLNYADRERFALEEFTKFIYGKRDLSEFDAYVETLKKTFMLNEENANTENKLRELGILK